MSEQARRMMELFSGYSGAHGTHGATGSTASGKVEIKKTARTVREPVTEALWDEHLAGERALGIIPIREDNTCVWGCIDVDRYDLNHSAVVAEIVKKKLPLVLCKSKSGGAHVFLFLSEPVPATEIRAALSQMAAAMGWGDCEIFPKQTQVLAERGDLGNWLNMPYLGGNKTQRYSVKETMGARSVDEFLNYAEKMRTSLESIPKARKNVDLEDGPPCLQHLTSTGFPEGTRNNGLFALGIYCQKKFGENWKPELENMNRQYMNPPLTSDEVLMVMRNLERKEYNYSCKEQPLCGHCESALCRARRFGVGGAGLFPVVSGLSKLEAQPPIWFLDIEEQRVELTTQELQNYRDFQKVCMEQLTIFYMPMRAETWAALVGSAMQSAVIIEASPEMSVEGHFMELLESFCMDRHRGERPEDIHQGRPWMDPDTKIHWFRLKDLMELLSREGFRTWGRNKVGSYLTEIGHRHGRNIDNKFVNLFGVHDDLLQATPQTKLPPVPRDPI